MALIEEITQIGKKKDNVLSPILPTQNVVNPWTANEEPASAPQVEPSPIAPQATNYINNPWSDGKPIAPTPIQSAVDSGDYMAVLKQYFPKPDYEDEKKRAKRAQKGAFISDLARVVAQTGSSLGGSWMIPQGKDRTSAATANYNNVLAMEKAANRDYQGRLASAALRGVELKKAQEAAKANQEFERMKFGYQANKDNKELQLKLMEIDNRYKLGLISAEQKRKETNELIRHNKKQEGISSRNASATEKLADARAGYYNSKDSGGEKGNAHVYLKDNNNNKVRFDYPKSMQKSLSGYLYSKIVEKAGEDGKKDIAMMMASLGESADSNSKMEAMVNYAGSKYPGLLEEARVFVENGGGNNNVPLSYERDKGVSPFSPWLKPEESSEEKQDDFDNDDSDDDFIKLT